MSYAAHGRQFDDCIEFSADAVARQGATAKPSLLQRVAHALSHWEHRQLDREMEQMLARSGGQITDGLEREMMQRLTGAYGGPRA